MLNIWLKSKKKLNFTGCINAFRVIERLQRMNILGDQNDFDPKMKIKNRIFMIECKKCKM